MLQQQPSTALLWLPLPLSVWSHAMLSLPLLLCTPLLVALLPACRGVPRRPASSVTSMQPSRTWAPRCTASAATAPQRTRRSPSPTACPSHCSPTLQGPCARWARAPYQQHQRAPHHTSAHHTSTSTSEKQQHGLHRVPHFSHAPVGCFDVCPFDAAAVTM